MPQSDFDSIQEVASRRKNKVRSLIGADSYIGNPILLSPESPQYEDGLSTLQLFDTGSKC